MMAGTISTSAARKISEKMCALSLTINFILKGCKVIEITVLALLANGNK
jgi:hypothetical protein